MKKLNLFITVFFLLTTQKTDAKDTIIVLQNGLNNYSGCYDALTYDGYFNNSLDSINYGNDTLLTVFFGNNGSR